jgi:hypothetical protein
MPPNYIIGVQHFYICRRNARVDATRARDAYNVISWYNVALLSTNEQNQSLSDFRIFQMHAIPTTHAGLNMRSRLEARKGAFQ